MKHNKWVVFYTLAVSSLFIFALFILKDSYLENFPTIGYFSSPEALDLKISILCKLEKYESIALSSARLYRDEYVVIDGSELDEGAGGYIEAAGQLCKSIDYARKIEKTKTDGDLWVYDFRFGLFHDSGREYKVVLLDRQWRYVLVVDEN